MIFTTERLLLPGEQVEAAAAGGEVAVVAELPALPHLGVTREALTALELLVGVAGEGRELALERNDPMACPRLTLGEMESVKSL